MKNILFFLFTTTFAVAQTNTEVYLFNLDKNNGNWSVGNGKNISNNPGYDSQPYFYSNNLVIFSSTRNKQTDIAAYNIKTGEIKFINTTPNGGEYSPQRIPKSKDISAVRLDTDGLQRFYKYNYKTGESTEIIADLKVAYPMWLDKNTTINVVIVGEDLDLIKSELKLNRNTTIQKKVGRSVHHIPNTTFVSYINKEKEQWEVTMFNPNNGERRKIIETIGKKEDICWLPDGTLLMAVGNTLMKFNPATDKNWSIFHTFPKNKFKNISRILVNSRGTQLALVSD
ncbi:TolB family protein [Polaribacter gochangensis]|uniref:TolB family protein n=1 Tax=Polaribacter gochangensis TaxID=3252903 RepID=UPI003904C099